MGYSLYVLAEVIEQNRNYAKSGIKTGIVQTAIILSDQRLVWATCKKLPPPALRLRKEKE
jgi:hypothetical protein